ncbi:MAG: hypothetical protein K2Y28_00970 [Burkholderiaceae bacterium]|nr:hypothetical protein [Burkholderiaceae bacterium]
MTLHIPVCWPPKPLCIVGALFAVRSSTDEVKRFGFQMDRQLTALALIGIAIGVKDVGSFITRRRGPHARQRCESLTDGFRVKVAS